MVIPWNTNKISVSEEVIFPRVRYTPRIFFTQELGERYESNFWLWRVNEIPTHSKTQFPFNYIFLGTIRLRSNFIELVMWPRRSFSNLKPFCFAVATDKWFKHCTWSLILEAAWSLLFCCAVLYQLRHLLFLSPWGFFLSVDMWNISLLFDLCNLLEYAVDHGQAWTSCGHFPILNVVASMLAYRLAFCRTGHPLYL